jgi:hypothetical protein
MLFWIQYSQGPNRPDISQGLTFHIRDLQIPKAFLMTCSLASLERAREPQTTHMSLLSDLDFVLFDLDMATYQASLGSPFPSLSALGLFLALLEDV